MINLIHRSQVGDSHAFTELFEQYKNLVFRVALLMLDDPDEAEDALQEVFIQVYRSLHTYDPQKGAFTTWLHQITVNHCLNRKRKRWLGLIPLEHIPQKSLAARSRSIEDRFAEDESLRRALNRLSDKLRAVVVLRYYAELSYAEIAQALGIPIGTVQSRLNQAMGTLREALKETEAPTLAAFDLAKDEG
jgi:RNA polymerase sigma-70 factor (ECF subfamily)